MEEGKDGGRNFCHPSNRNLPFLEHTNPQASETLETVVPFRP